MNEDMCIKLEKLKSKLKIQICKIIDESKRKRDVGLPILEALDETWKEVEGELEDYVSDVTRQAVNDYMDDYPRIDDSGCRGC